MKLESSRAAENFLIIFFQTFYLLCLLKPVNIIEIMLFSMQNMNVYILKLFQTFYHLMNKL